MAAVEYDQQLSSDAGLPAQFVTPRKGVEGGTGRNACFKEQESSSAAHRPTKWCFISHMK